MSEDKQINNSEEESSSEDVEDEDVLEKIPPKAVKKRKRKSKTISEIKERFDSTDEDKLNYEITTLLKKARVAIAEKNYVEAIKCYQDASIAAGMLGDTEREKIYITRANEILSEHPELKAAGIKVLKKCKRKAMLRKEEEKFSIIRLISHVIVAGIILGLVLSGLFSAIILQEIFEVGGSYNVPLLWGISITVEITGMIMAYVIGKYWLSWSE